MHFAVLQGKIGLALCLLRTEHNPKVQHSECLRLDHKTLLTQRPDLSCDYTDYIPKLIL